MRSALFLAVALAAAALAACGGGDADPSSSRLQSPTGAGGAKADASSPGASNGGGDSPGEPVPAGPVDILSGAPTFTATKPARSAAQTHQAKGVNPDEPTGRACVASGCHGPNSAPFAFAVTVCGDAKCRDGAADVEVRVQGADGAIFQAWTDTDGNAWFPDNGKLTFPAKAALLGAGQTKRMASALEGGTYGGSCNTSGCHGRNPGNLPPDAAPPNVVLHVEAKDGGAP